MVAGRIIGKPLSFRTRLKHRLELIYSTNDIKFIKRKLRENSCSRGVQDCSIALGEYHYLSVIMHLL